MKSVHKVLDYTSFLYC